MSAAIYPGTFDPITRGHMSIIHSSLVAFDRLVVAVLNNPKKEPLFSVDERIEMIRDTLREMGADESRVEVDTFDGLLVDYVRTKEIPVIVRGLRAVADFEYELAMANMNRHLDENVETVFIMANDAYFYVASNLVKEVASLGGDVSKLIPECVERRLLDKLGK
jgi:pantetheine-phosphate adenylyltransferase